MSTLDMLNFNDMNNKNLDIFFAYCVVYYP